jgi:hypothetical protein
MPKKRIPSADEIEVMAADILLYMKHGETIRPFIRRNRERLRAIVKDESWATLALVLTKAGITYGTGRPWTEHILQQEFFHATAPSKRQNKHVSSGSQQPAHGHEKFSQNAELIAEGAQRPQALIRPRFTPATVRRHEPGRILSDDEMARQEALDERVFGKTVRR